MIPTPETADLEWSQTPKGQERLRGLTPAGRYLMRLNFDGATEATSLDRQTSTLFSVIVIYAQRHGLHTTIVGLPAELEETYENV